VQLGCNLYSATLFKCTRVHRQKGPVIRIILQLISRFRTTIATMKLFIEPIINFNFGEIVVLTYQVSRNFFRERRSNNRSYTHVNDI